MKKYKAGIVGAAGYTGGELIRLLIHHPTVEIAFAHSKSNAGAKVFSVHYDLLGECDLYFTEKMQDDVDVIFLCMEHGESSKLILNIDPRIRVIDLSQDFRLESPVGREFIYGLTEYNLNKIAKSTSISNPGCFATAVQLALLPLAKQQLLFSDIIVHCTTGSTGAGQSLSRSSHFGYRQNNLSAYKSFTHQHQYEILKTIRELQPDFSHKINMFPQRGAFARGIFASITLVCELELDKLRQLFQEYYKDSNFVFISNDEVHLKQVINTNKCLIYLEKQDDQLMIISVIDNLLKGASGQAIQNMNVMLGLSQHEGLKLKAIAY